MHISGNVIRNVTESTRGSCEDAKSAGGSKAEITEEAWASLHSDTSRPFDKPKSGRIAVKVINHLGDEVMKVFRVASQPA
jgi:hypothetical protein